MSRNRFIRLPTDDDLSVEYLVQISHQILVTTSPVRLCSYPIGIWNSFSHFFTVFREAVTVCSILLLLSGSAGWRLLFVGTFSLSVSSALTATFRLFTLTWLKNDVICWLMPHGMTLQGRLPDYPGSVKRFITVEITLVSSVVMILTLEKETRQSLGAPRVVRTSHTNDA